MPSARLGPEAMVEESIKIEPQIFKSDYSHNLIDTAVVPYQNIITQVGGYPIYVDWYSQYLKRDQDVDGHNPVQNSPLQQYTRIKNTKLKLSSPMNYSMQATNATDVYTGDGRVAIPGIRPKEGDVFLADIGQGRLGMFTISNPLALSQYDSRVYQFDFKLTALATISAVQELDSRVVRKYSYVEDFIVNGQDPLLTDERLDSYFAAQRLLETLIKQYMAESFSQEFSTLLIGGQYGKCYDPYVARFFMKLVEVEAHPYIRRMKLANVDDNNTLQFIDIFSVLLDRDPSMLSMCFTNASFRPVSDYSSNKQVGSIAFSGLDNVIYPMQPLAGPDSDPLSGCECDGSTGYIGSPIFNNAPTTIQYDGVNLLDSIGSGSYVFAPSFYDETNENESIMTMVVRTYLQGLPVNRELIFQMAETRRTWSAVDRFYYTPILIMLLRAALVEI